MVKRRPERGQDPTETAGDQIGRLISACARIQSDVERLLKSEPAWAVERGLLKAIINQVPELLYA